MAKLFVMGAGWGTALAVMFNRYGHRVSLWTPFEEELEDIRRHGEHRRLLPQMLPIVEKMDQVGYHSVECWGGATFDASLRFLKEDPWAGKVF